MRSPMRLLIAALLSVTSAFDVRLSAAISRRQAVLSVAAGSIVPAQATVVYFCHGASNVHWAKVTWHAATRRSASAIGGCSHSGA